MKDTECPYTTPEGPARSHWIRGRHVGGKSITWGRQSYRLCDFDFKAASPRRLRRRLADRLRRAGALLRPRRELHRHQRAGRGPAAAARRQVPAAHAAHLRRAAAAQRRQAEVRAHADHRPRRHPDRAAQRPARRATTAVPASRGCSPARTTRARAARCRAAEKTGRLTLITDAVVSHVVLDDDGRCPGVAYIDRLTREPREVHAQGRWCSAPPPWSPTRILLNSRRPAPERHRELERRARPLPDGPRDGRRRRRHPARARKEPTRAARPAQRHLRPALPQHRRTSTRTSSAATASRAARASRSGATPSRCPASAPPSRRRCGSRALVHQLRRVRRVPAPLRELLELDQDKRRRLGHPRPAHQHGPRATTRRRW